MPQFAAYPSLFKRQMQSRTNGAPPIEGFRRRDDCWVIFGSLAYLTSNLFLFPSIPVLLGGDQVFFWMDAQRLLHGERIYRDFFQFTGPGTDMVYLGAFSLFGSRIWVPNIIVLVLGVALGWTCFRIAQRILPRRLALLAVAFIVVVLYGRLLNATHHWFGELAVLTAVLVMMKDDHPRRIVLSGFLLGLATFFTQTRGPAAAFAIAVYFLWHGTRTRTSWRIAVGRIAPLACSLIVTWLALSSYFIVTIGWRELWHWQVVYVLRYQVQDSRFFGLPNEFTWKTFPFTCQVLTVYLALPIAFTVSLWHTWRGRHERPTQAEAPRVLLTLVGIATALEVAQSPNWLRVYCVAAPGILLTGWLIGQFGRYQRFAKGLLWTIVLCLALQQTLGQHRNESVPMNMPAGTAFTSNLKAQKLEWIREHTKPEDYFFQAPWPGVYLPLQLRNPVFAEAFRTADVTRPEFVTQAIGQLDAKHVRYVLWSPHLDSPEPIEGKSAYHLAPFRDFLHDRYHKVWTFPDGDEIWQRK